MSFACALLALPIAAQLQIASAQDLNRLSIEELAQIKVTSVSKTEEPLSEAAAAIYVITQDAIRRSGAQTLPEILRLAPNLYVARQDANTYAITARGFNQSNGTANKLLVLIDGRVVYSPLFSGTFWDAQKTFIDDIDRIEVISGPGGTLWGANAVNGVINIITKDSILTRGVDVDASAGSLDQRLAARLGGSAGATGSFRVYGLDVAQGAMVRQNGDSARDSWNHLQTGVRADWHRGVDTMTVQGDAYRGTGMGLPSVLPSGEISGGNISGAWQRESTDGSALRVQAYADRTRRLLVSGIDARLDQYALETQYNFSPLGRNAIVIGGGYRLTSDDFRPGPGTVFLSPSSRKLDFANVFAQDAIALSKQFKLTIGTKIEHNTYTGVELMPDVRLAWTPARSITLWSAVSRAVRTPSRFDTDLVNRGILDGNPDFESEDLIAYELGYRGLLSPNVSLSVSAFHDSYERLRTVEASGPSTFPLILRNNMLGHTDGVEAWGDFSLRDWWRMSAGVATLHKDLRLAAGSRDVFGVAFAGNDPHYQWMARSDFDLARDIQLDLGLRSAGRLASPAVDAYTEADVRIGWQARKNVVLSVEGQNLLHARHVEFINPSLAPEEVPRSIAVAARWSR